MKKREKITTVDLEKKLLQKDAKILPADEANKLCCIYDCIDNARYKIVTGNEEIYQKFSKKTPSSLRWR